jgi:hypothetical protein
MKPRNSICQALLMGLAFCFIMTARADERTLMLVPLPEKPAWQDMAFLAAVPAATLVNNGAPSLVALDATATLSPEVLDYARRYRPDRVFLLGGATNGLVVAGRACDVLKASTAEEAACRLSAAFWQTSGIAVICQTNNYEDGLVAAPLAARLRAPLLFVGAQGLSKATQKELRRLNVQELIVIGIRKPGGGGVPALQQVVRQVTLLLTARDVMAWTRKRGLPVSYLAAVNPLDRERTVIKKLSLSGALLAAGRKGLVAPLTYDVQWKLPFKGTEVKGDHPKGLPKSEAKPKEGRIILGKQQYAFMYTSSLQNRNRAVNIDLNGDGIFSGSKEGPFLTGDLVELDGKRYALTLGGGNNETVKPAEVHLTWPLAESLVEDLQGYYETLGSPPEHLCLVGFPDAIPQAIIGKGGVVQELTSDLPYSNADADPFAEIGVARVIGENASFTTLFASRVLTYPSLLDPEWMNRACQARWENTSAKQFENVGFDASYLHTKENLKWLIPPADGKKGKRANTFEQDSPLAHCAALTHMDHSWWHELGCTFGWDAEVLLAPVVIESGGCLTAALDREPDYRSVIARMFRKGAVAFSGNAREGVASQELQRMEFWNGVLTGQTIGQAHRRSINSALVTIQDRKEQTGGSYWYQVRIRTQFGDPAFVLRVPSAPRSAPARVMVKGETVTVHAPAQWWPTKMFVPEDWKQWAGKDLFALRGAGTYARREWCSAEYDREETFLTAEFTTRRLVAKIEQVQNPPGPLGWNGSYYVDENADGSRTYRWAVRLADFDQTKGSMVNAVEKLDYYITYL